MIILFDCACDFKISALRTDSRLAQLARSVIVNRIKRFFNIFIPLGLKVNNYYSDKIAELGLTPKTASEIMPTESLKTWRIAFKSARNGFPELTPRQAGLLDMLFENAKNNL